MFCTQCGQQLVQGDRFCGNCGAPLMGPQPPLPAPSGPDVGRAVGQRHGGVAAAEQPTTSPAAKLALAMSFIPLFAGFAIVLGTFALVHVAFGRGKIRGAGLALLAIVVSLAWVAALAYLKETGHLDEWIEALRAKFSGG